MGEQIEFLSNHCKEHGIEHDKSIDTQILDLAGEKIRKNSSFCSFFQEQRRGYLYTNSFPRQGYNKVALGHHLDDAMESYFYESILQWNNENNASKNILQITVQK